MAVYYRTNGFIFKKEERSESDQIFTVFTKDFGKVELKGRAIRKINSKLRPDIDMFYLSEVEFIQGKSGKTLTDAIKIEKFSRITSDLNVFKIAQRVCSLLDIFVKGQEKDEKTFELLTEVFYKLADDKLKEKNSQLAFQYFLWNFISLQGYHLQVKNCAVCGDKLNPYNVYFLAKEGGILCKKCLPLDRSAKKINSDVVKILRLIFKKDWQTISKLKVGQPSQKLLENISEGVVHAFCPA